jgi:hypothetical protein
MPLSYIVTLKCLVENRRVLCSDEIGAHAVKSQKDAATTILVRAVGLAVQFETKSRSSSYYTRLLVPTLTTFKFADVLKKAQLDIVIV